MERSARFDDSGSLSRSTQRYDTRRVWTKSIRRGAVAFDDWLDRFFRSYYRHRPVNATFIGVHEYDELLPDFSRNGVADVVGEMWSLLDELERLPAEDLTTAQLMDRALAEGFLRVQLWEYGSRHFSAGNPSLYVSEGVFGPLSLFLRDSRPLQERLDAARSRLERVAALLEQAKENVLEAPAAWIEKAADECLGGIAFASLGVPQYLALNEAEDSTLEQAGVRAAAAFSDYRDHLLTNVRPLAGEAYACGSEGLELCLRHGHFLTMTADEIVDYARAVMDESRVALEQGAGQFGATDWRAALAMLADEHPDAAGYEDAYTLVWERAREIAIDQRLVNWPDYPIRYVPRPVWARAAAPHLYFLFYRAPSAFDRVEVVDYLFQPRPDGASPEDLNAFLRAHNDSVIKTNHVIHHGGLGHHVQNWNAYNRAESRIGRVAAVDCASRIAMLCGGTLAEGWACYTTDLMSETDFYTPLESYSMHHSRLRMAARAIADVGLHTGRISLDDAAELYRSETAMSALAARNEAVKNSMNPGAALMYLIGTDLIHELRRELVGDASGTSLRDFHDRFLAHGSVPVQMIADAMRAEAPPGA
jgi:hypothetical protein